ncbi:hypothetical protein QYE76_043855 [Lolium multiflorum]|uniref:Uncharacterized protein n=1 Tax=Lolium multiflorum TaxID=4521 RepID=A0AAD8TJJ2_LOLMU|nr:hypothetical protein QYE76_043855 [Lolium multiflorum]
MESKRRQARHARGSPDPELEADGCLHQIRAAASARALQGCTRVLPPPRGTGRGCPASGLSNAHASPQEFGVQVSTSLSWASECLDLWCLNRLSDIHDEYKIG